MSWHCHECVNGDILGEGEKHKFEPSLLWI